ncbi:MAG: hypothetical protein V3T83_21595 [Acidobacteriota bacterium]
MESAMSFNDVLEAVDKLSPSEQEELVQVVYRRNIERRRSQIAEDAREARQEFQAGRHKAATVSEIIDEIES